MDDVEALINVAREQLEQIEEEYQQSLSNKIISSKLSIYIKNYLENLRSPLDYIVSEICENVLRIKSSRNYFPVSCENLTAFQKHMDRNLPSLDTIDSNLYQVFEKIQPYNSSGCQALPKLSKLVNINKHNALSPQKRIERKGLNIQFPGGASISMGPGSSISGGGIISSGGAWVSPAGGSISGDTPARVCGGGIQQTVTKWISFTFDETGDEVLPLLKECLNDIIKITNDFNSLLIQKTI